MSARRAGRQRSTAAPARAQPAPLALPGEPTFFADRASFRSWLGAHHATAPALLIGLVRVGGGEGLGYRDALDEALCFGWIDGVRYGIDERRWAIRFSPRKPRSVWSAINIRRMAELEAEGRVTEAGRAAFAARSQDRSEVYSFEQGEIGFAAEEEARFRANPEAWSFWETRPKSYRKPATWWVVSAKRPETRARRLATLIADSAAGRTVRHLTPPARR